GDRGEAERREVPADRSAPRLEHGEDRDHAEHEVRRRGAVHVVDDLVEEEEDVRRDRDRGDDERNIDEADALQETRVGGRECEGEHEDRGEEEHHVDLRRRDRLAEEPEGRDEEDVRERDLRAGGRVVEREQRGGDRQDRDGAGPCARERPCLRLALVLLDELLGLLVGEDRFEVRSRDDLGRVEGAVATRVASRVAWRAGAPTPGAPAPRTPGLTHRVPSRSASTSGRRVAVTWTTVSPNAGRSSKVQRAVRRRCWPAGVTRMRRSGTSLVGGYAAQRPSAAWCGSTPRQPKYSMERMSGERT